MADHYQINERQQAALVAIYHADQEAEQGEAARWRIGWERRPASVWRRLRYPDIGWCETPLHRNLRKANVIDEGLGSTLEALERRNLIECNYCHVRQKLELFSIKLTKTGRAASRLMLGEAAPKKMPKGQLKSRQWEALCVAYAGGEDGVQGKFGDYGGFSWRWTWLRLRDYKPNGLVQERSHFFKGEHKYDLVITEAGRKYYIENREQYQKLYPDSFN